MAIAAIAAGCGGSSSHSMSSSEASARAQTNDVDVAFVREMAPHHKLAVAMAKAARDRAGHAKLKTLAVGIIKAQTNEIAQLTAIADSIGVTTGSASGSTMSMGEGTSTGSDTSASTAKDAKTLGLSMAQMGMSMKMSTLRGAKPFDRAFIDLMIPHHQGAIRMARAELARGRSPQLKKIATAIVADQIREIGRMNTWRKSWYGQISPAGGVPT